MKILTLSLIESEAIFATTASHHHHESVEVIEADGTSCMLPTSYLHFRQRSTRYGQAGQTVCGGGADEKYREGFIQKLKITSKVALA